MRRNTILLLAALALSKPSTTRSAEPIAAPAPSAPTPPTVAAIDSQALVIHQYFYVDFPRQLQTLENETQLAEAELALIARRVESYRPFRSFGRYAATYTVDQSWQIALFAAQHRLECLRNDRADLWRQRGLAAVALSGETLR